MHLKTIKTAAELPFKGIELVKTDGQITEIVIGGKLHIRKGSDYSAHLALLIERPHEVEDRYRMTATREGFDPKVLWFPDSYAAEQSRASYERDGAAVTVEKVSALIAEDGTAVGEATEAAPEQQDAELIPF